MFVIKDAAGSQLRGTYPTRGDADAKLSAMYAAKYVRRPEAGCYVAPASARDLETQSSWGHG